MVSMQQAIRSIVVGAVLARERWQSGVAYNPLSRSRRPSHRLPGDGCCSPVSLPSASVSSTKVRGFEPTGD